MFRTILGSLAGLAVTVAGVAFFIWLLWWLWSRREEEEETPVIELKTEPLSPAVDEEKAGAPVAEAEAAEEAAEEMADAGAEVAEEAPEEMTDAEAAGEAPEEAAEAPAPDDLKRIEGIGPKISSVLQEAGITTFAQLADTDPASLEEILEAADPRLRRLANPATWPEQAALAAADEWEAHEALRGELKGGRRA